MNTALYDELGMTPNATTEQIKAAYRELVKRHHPDVGGDPEAFRRIQEAYDVLSDPKRRERYDQTGATDTMDREVRLDALARERFGAMLIQLVERNDPFLFARDLIDLAKRDIAAERRAIERDIKEVKAKRDNADKLDARFKPKAETTLAHDVFAHVRRQLDQAIAQGEERIELCKRLDALFDGYEFEREKAPAAYADPGPKLTQSTINDILRQMHK